MEEIFDSKVLDVLEYAQKLDLANEKEAAKTVCRCCVEEKASHSGEDMLRLFYGNHVYDGLKDAQTALTYIYIAKCAAKVFDVASQRGPADAPNGWTKSGFSCNNQPMRDAMDWLQKKDRSVQKEDARHLESILKAICPPGNLVFELSDPLKQESLISIMRGLVSGKIKMTAGGKIQ